MGRFKALTRFLDTAVGTAALLIRDNFMDVALALVMPQVNNQLQVMFPAARPQSSFLSQRLAARTVDGAILEGKQGWQKLAIRKGLPDPTSTDKRLGVENEPHLVDGFSGQILEGYGKGRKTLIADEIVVTKVGGKTRFARMNYHEHDAERAGLHYDLVVEGVPEHTNFEMHVPRGSLKGRYAFTQTPRGVLITLMKDRGVQLAKPPYKLKGEDFLAEVESNRTAWVIEQKEDGALANANIYANRSAFRSHRDTGQTYYGRLPGLDSLENRSPFWLWRKIAPGPDLNGTVLQGEIVHPDGVARTSGILNALPVRAHQIQALRGEPSYYVWDIQKLRGKDVSHLPYSRRRELIEDVVRDASWFNKNWKVVPKCPDHISAQEFYERVKDQPLPHGEGLVIKRADGVYGETWFKIKPTDLLDLEIVAGGFIEGNGKYSGSLGALTVRDPETGSVGEVGSGFSDFEREWIWRNRELLEGSVVKVRVMENTGKSFRAPVFHSFHEGKGNTEHGLLMYAESLAGGPGDEMMRTKYRLINAH